MKNIEKYTNTKDALEAYNALDLKKVPFDVWLECEFEEPRVPTLIEAAQELKGLWDKSISSCQSVKLETWNDAIDRLSDAIEREKRKPFRNHDNGNAAKGREAMERIRKELILDSCLHPITAFHDIVCEITYSALKEPPRRCDALSKDEVLKMLEDRSFSKEDTIEWLYGKAEGGTDGSK